MATYVPYSPTGIISRAMFNFDATGGQNFRLLGLVKVSVSDSFGTSDYQRLNFFSYLYTPGQNEYPWAPSQLDNIRKVLDIYSQFVNIQFSGVTDYDSTTTSSIATPEDVGRSDVSDINISWIYRTDAPFAGVSGINVDSSLNYSGASGDIFLNQAASKFLGDYTFSSQSRVTQTLLHELGHSLGLSHPHSSYSNGVPAITADYAATQFIGFDKFGFKINSAADMYKEYFSIMSYDDQNAGVVNLNAFTPMILDVIALQQAYGEGGGTSGSGDDIIKAGNFGYRTYFDTGGVDTVDLSVYTDGAYFNMGETITSASHLVGLAMSINDANTTIVNGGDPVSLRWFYGEYENAIGSANVDLIVGNDLSNTISGKAGDDYINGRGGNDDISGGDGNDTLYGGAGDDRFDWAASERNGNDVFYGGTGNDTYVLDSNLDTVVENSSEGVDTIWVSFNSTLANYQFVENIRAYGENGVTLVGNSYGNIMSGSTGNDYIDGATGADTVLYKGVRSNYTVSKSGNGFIVRDSSGVDGTDTLINIELLKFTDLNLSFDIAGIAGQAYRLYQAAFDRKPDLVGLGYWIADMTKGSSLTTVSSGFFQSLEFQKLYGSNPNTTTLITNFYQNVLHRAPDQAGLDYWAKELSSGRITPAGALASFCESSENQALVIGSIQNGIEYTAWLG